MLNQQHCSGTRGQIARQGFVQKTGARNPAPVVWNLHLRAGRLENGGPRKHPAHNEKLCAKAEKQHGPEPVGQAGLQAARGQEADEADQPGAGAQGGFPERAETIVVDWFLC